ARRGRDVPRLRGPHPGRVVDRAARAGGSGRSLAPRGGRVMSAETVLQDAVDRHGDRLVLLCSFQKEESVLVDALTRVEGGRDVRVVTIDTGVLFPETLATWRAFEQRFGVEVATEDARHPDGRWTADD